MRHLPFHIGENGKKSSRGVQVITYLMDFGDHCTSHAFVDISLITVERYLWNELDQAKCTLSSSTTIQATNTNLIDFIEDGEEKNASATEEHFSIEHSSDPQNSDPVQAAHSMKVTHL